MRVIVPVKIYQEMRAYAQSTDAEISGLGRVTRETNRIIRVEEIRIFNQEVSSSHTELDSTDLGRFYSELVAEDADVENWRLWFHSHANMDLFWSGTDERTIEEFDNQEEGNNWLLSIETNRRGEIKARVDIFKPLRVVIDDVEWVMDYADADIKERIEEEVEQKVVVSRSMANKVGRKVKNFMFGEEKRQSSPYWDKERQIWAKEGVDTTILEGAKD